MLRTLPCHPWVLNPTLMKALCWLVNVWGLAVCFWRQAMTGWTPCNFHDASLMACRELKPPLDTGKLQEKLHFCCLLCLPRILQLSCHPSAFRKAKAISSCSLAVRRENADAAPCCHWVPHRCGRKAAVLHANFHKSKPWNQPHFVSWSSYKFRKHSL